jgi:GNAT superfamily N-acetyltransferase
MHKLSETLYAKYISEREGLEIFETEHSFVTYKLSGDECFIKNMCVLPDERAHGRARYLINQLGELAKASNCKFITANIDLKDKGASNTLLAALRIGFKVIQANNDLLFIALGIGGEK